MHPRSAAALFLVIVLAAAPLGGSLHLPASGLDLPTAPTVRLQGAAAGIPLGLWDAAHAKDAPGILRAVAQLPGVAPPERAGLQHVADTFLDPSWSNLVGVGELYWLGHLQEDPVLAVPDARTAFLGLFEAAGATPSAEVLAAMEGLDALPPQAQEALGLLAAAETYSLQQARLAFARLGPAEIDLLMNPFTEHHVQHLVDWAPLLLAQRVQLASLDRAASLLEDLAPQPFVMEQCEVVFVSLQERDNLHACDALLLVDLHGDDEYVNNAGGTGFERVPRAAMLLDMAGNDHYHPMATGEAAVVGGGILGAGALYDRRGDDTYMPMFYPTGTMGAGAAIGGAAKGVGSLVDREGHDVYETRGAYYAGVIGGSRSGHAVMLDGHGDDRYEADLEMAGGAMGGSDRGSAVMVELGGDDRYLLTVETRGGVEAGAAGGSLIGYAALLEYGGDDVYESVFMGMMGSGGANGGASGKGFGVLVEVSGDDSYSNHGMMDSAANGAANTGGVGVLIDLGGDDVSMGVLDMDGALNGSSDLAVGVYVNVEGDDVYDAVFCHPATGGINGGSFAGIGILLDIGGRDRYRDTVVHGDMPMDSEEEGPCMMMMPMGAESMEGTWRWDVAEVARGEGMPVRLATGVLFDDSAETLGVGNPVGVDLAMLLEMYGPPDEAPVVPLPGLPAGLVPHALEDPFGWAEMWTPDAALVPLLLQGLEVGGRPATDYQPRLPVTIRGDAGFTAANGVVGGSGTPQDPYVIAGWVFTPGVLEEAAVVLEGTTKSVVVRDNLFPQFHGPAGILLRGASNVLVEHNVCIMGSDCYTVLGGGHAVFRENLAYRGGNAFHLDGADVLLARNDVVSNAEGVNYRFSTIVAQGNEFVSNRDSIVGRTGDLFLRDNNFRFSGGKSFNMRTALMTTDTFIDACMNWWGHPSGPMIMGYEPMPGPAADPTPAGILHWGEEMLMMAHAYSGDVIMSNPPAVCWDPWLTSPSMDAGWLL